MTRVLVLGASGMLGHVSLRLFAGSPGFEAIGAVRSKSAMAGIASYGARIVAGFDATDEASLAVLIGAERPDVVINCVGLVKQLADAGDVLAAVPINTLLPHRLIGLTAAIGARLVHVSTDCVFSGDKGGYRETDRPDAADVYGLSKLLGEVDAPNAVTLRTSIIGPELASAHGLVGWFLAQSGSVKGFTRAIFSGLPTVELARVIRDHVLPHPELRGVHHVSAAPIAKFDLLKLVAETYGKPIAIAPSDALVIDRSLDSARFRAATGYVPPAWPDLVRAMRDFG